MPSTSPFKTVLRVCQPPDNNQQPQENEKESLSLIAANGTVLGTGSQATFKLRPCSKADAVHGTLERTSKLGVWVYSDHSRDGTILNNEHKVHHDAVVVRQGDTLKLGQSEIQLCLENGTLEAVREGNDGIEDKDQVSRMRTKQDKDMGTTRAARLARRRASSPWGTSSLTRPWKQPLQIDTAGLERSDVPSLTSLSSIATPEALASRGSGTRWRHKRNSIATTTVRGRSGQPPSFHRSRTRFVRGSDLVQVDEHVETISRPPPLEYSSSPIVSPSCVLTRKRHAFLPPANALPVPTPLDFSTDRSPSPFVRVTARRDDLRIQVSKKMAAAAPMSTGKTPVSCVVPKALEFAAPASPVAQREIQKQQESLQTILQHRNKEEQLLKQQQEEWMRTTCVEDEKKATLMPNESENQSLEVEPVNLAFFPVQAPVLLRTISLGTSEQATFPSSSHVSGAIRASRTRLNSFDEMPFGNSQHQDSKGRRKTTALVLTPSSGHADESELSQLGTENETRVSTESVSSTATTVIACHRRVTSSLVSETASSVDLCDFEGYEEETNDMVTSYTTTDLYGSDELLRHSQEDSTLLSDAKRIGGGNMYGTLSPPPLDLSCGSSPLNAADTRLGSPRRCGPMSLESSQSSDTFVLEDNQEAKLGNTFDKERVWSLKDDHFDPHSPYKVIATSKDGQQSLPRKLRRPTLADEDGESMDKRELRQSRPQSFRRRASFRHYALKPLTGTNKT